MTQHEEPTGVPESTSAERASRRPLWVRVLLGIGATIVGIVVLALVLYNFGGMGGSANDPAMKQQYERLVQAGEITPVREAFVIPIPGCTCHSTDPRLTEEHRYYHMNQCMDAGCHG